MGIGYPLDVVLCSALGGDMYDSVYPTRTARMGNALIPGGSLRIKNTSFKDDLRQGSTLMGFSVVVLYLNGNNG